MVDNLIEIASYQPLCKYGLIITKHDDHLTQSTHHLQNIVVYQVFSEDHYQDAFEKVFHALLKTFLSEEMYLDPDDIYTSKAYKDGKHHLHIHQIAESQLGNKDTQNLFNNIATNTTIVLNFDLSPTSFSLNKVRTLAKSIFDSLSDHFDGEIFYSCRAIKENHQENLIYVSYLSG